MSNRRYAIPAGRREHRRSFACFGGTCTVIVADASRTADAAAAAAMAQDTLLGWHRRFSRFDPDSELMRFNRDRRRRVPVSPLLRHLVEAALSASRDTGGLVDATLGAEIERAGYAADFQGKGIPLETALSLAPPRAPAGSSPIAASSRIASDPSAGAIIRPPGTMIDPGGIAKGAFADELVALLAGFDAVAIDCAGDIRLGGRGRTPRAVQIESPFDGSTLHTFELRDGGVATSGIGKRSWLKDGLPAHHLLDPRTGRPAFTGVVQATALAPTALEAEVLPKAAVLSGPERAGEWLSYGGVVVYDDCSYAVLGPAGAAASPVGSIPTVAAAPAAAPTRAPSQLRISASTSSCSGSFKISW
jgi:thiamine biosynthesis lipoprotein